MLLNLLDCTDFNQPCNNPRSSNRHDKLISYYLDFININKMKL